MYLQTDALSQHDINLHNSSQYIKIMQIRPILTGHDVNMPILITFM